MARAHVKKDEMVVVITGADRGKSGRVLSVDKEKNRVVIEGINRRRKNRQPSPESPQGSVLEVECPVHISNVMLQEEYERRRSAKPAAVAEDKDDQ